MKTIDAQARILKLEGVKHLLCFPHSPLIDAAAKVEIRPIVTRTERTLLNMADAYSRVTNGRKLGVGTVQAGPGSENVFPGVAQAFADSIPLLLLPGHPGRSKSQVPTTFDATENYRAVTKWTAQINLPSRVCEMMRRAYSLLRSGHPAPIVLEMPGDVATEELPDDAFQYTPPKRLRCAGDPQDVTAVAKALVTAKHPVLYVGHGALWAEATPELVELAELLQAPVITTLAAKSAFPENHPLSAGTAAYSGTAAADHFLKKADAVFGIGASLSRTVFAPPIAAGKVMLQNTIDEQDVNKDYAVDAAAIGDAKLVLEQINAELKDRLGPDGRKGQGTVAAELAKIKSAWLEKWMPKLTSDEVPINPYRVVWDLMHTVDRNNTIVTHDSGNPRDQLVPFYETLIPRGYIGWGKSTQLGTSLGLALGAKLAAPERQVINVIGDAGLGMCGMDLETAVREQIPILTVLLNNSCMGNYEKNLPYACEHYGTKNLTGHYADLAAALGAHAEKIENPAEVIPAIQRGLKANADGRSALVEIITREEELSKLW